MLPYDSLPFFREENAIIPHEYEELKNNLTKIHLASALPDLGALLHAEYQMRGNSQALLNIMGKQEVAGNLFYCQSFSILDTYDGYFTKRENTDSFELRFTLEGSGILNYRKKQYAIRKGEGFFISCQEPHYYRANKNGWKCTVFHINGKLCQQYFDEFAANGSVLFSNQSFPAFESLQFQVLKTAQKVTPYTHYRISCALDLLLTELLNASGQRAHTDTFADDHIAEIVSYLREHYSEKIVFETLAKEFGTSRSILFKKFKQYTGYTPISYLTDIRLTHAKFLLRTTALSIEQIATQTGFSDSGYFSQIFKKNTGITPLKFRKI